MDRCDCCGCTMKHKRIVSGLFACQDCREPAMKELGVTVTSIQIGFAVDSR